MYPPDMSLAQNGFLMPHVLLYLHKDACALNGILCFCVHSALSTKDPVSLLVGAVIPLGRTRLPMV